MANFHQFLMIFSWNASILDWHIYWMGEKGIRIGWLMAKAKTKNRSMTIQMVEFRMIMMLTHTHNGPMFHYKTLTDMY